MADRLTQLQDCLDDLLTQMYATLNYIETRHPYGDIPGQPSQAPEPAPTNSAPQSAVQQSSPTLPNGTSMAKTNEAKDTETGPIDRPMTPPPEQPAAFRSALRELAQGIVLKEQQMEILINSLPGLGNNEEDQIKRMTELEITLREVEDERAEAENEREALIDGLGEVIGKIGRIP